MLSLKNIICIVALLVSMSFSFSNVAFFGHDINSEEITDSNELKIVANIVNREDIVKSQIQVVHEIRRIDDLSLLYEERENYSLAPFEVRSINKTMELSEISSGEYFVTSQILSGSGAPLSRVRHEINIENSIEQKIKFSKLPYLRVFYDTGEEVRYEKSYSTTGRPIGKGEEFEVRFNIENLKDSEQDVTYEFDMRNSYDQEDSNNILEETITLNSLEEKEIIKEIKHDSPGTYNLFVKVYDEDNQLLANKEVRVVIIGAGGSIMDVFNSQDTYSKDERVKFNVKIVGPADSLSIVEDNDLKLEILKEDEVIYSQLNKIDVLPINPEQYSFSFLAPETLEYYKAKITLENNGIIYDEVILDYEPLSPEKIISPQGAVYDPSKDLCLDNGKCSDKEIQIGNCADCILEENERKRKEQEQENKDIESKPIQQEPNNNKSNNSLIYTVSLLVAIAIASIVYLVLTRIRGKEK